MRTPRALSRGFRGLAGGEGREFAVLASSTVLYQAARFAFMLVAARVLAPADFSTWALVITLLVYAPSLLFGISNGLGRELPILIGQTLEAEALRATRAAWGATVIAASAVILVAVIVAVLASPLAAPALITGALGAASIVLATQQFNLRSRLRFGASGAQLAAFGVVAGVAAVWLVVLADPGLETVGLAYGAAFVAAVVIGLVVDRPARLQVDTNEMRRLAAIGFPIMLTGLAFSLFVTLDRWVAVGFLGPDRAAPYALASLVSAAMLVIPTVISQQTYPRMAMARGQGASTGELRTMASRQGRMAALLAAPIALAIGLFAWVGVPVLLPAYADAVGVVIVLALGLLVMVSLTGYGNFLNVAGGRWRYLAAQSAGVVIGIVSMVIGAITAGLIGIAVGMAVSQVLYGLLLRAAAYRTELSDEPVSR
jgi:O-antigen/teichoic acid export membrane protein